MLKVDQDIVGYISASIIFDECNLIKIVVDSNHRSKGYGKLLVDYLIKYCLSHQVKKIYLEVRADNFVAQKLYNKMGFRKESVRKSYYDNSVDALIYWYYL